MAGILDFQNDSWILENAAARLVVDRQTGWLKSLMLKCRGLDLLNLPGQAEGAIGGVEVYEEKNGIHYSDLRMLSVAGATVVASYDEKVIDVNYPRLKPGACV